MEPPFTQFTITPDGVRVAYQTLGAGPAVVMLFPYHMNHLALNWDVSLHRHTMQTLAKRFQVVTLDFRGAGLSERDIESLTLDLLTSDVEAVLDALGIES